MTRRTLSRLPMITERRPRRVHRTLLMLGGTAYLGWWFVVHAALPAAFNPFGSRLAVVGCFYAVIAISYLSKSVAQRLEEWLTVCCCIATAHYFYLFDRNGGDLNWVVGSYITVTAVCAILQTSRSLLVYSLFVAALSGAIIARHRGGPYVVFLPGMLTSLLFANLGLFGRLRLLHRLQESHERIESLFDAGFDGIALHEGGIVRQVNGALGPLFGLTKDEFVGKELVTLFAPDSQAHVAEMIARQEDTPWEADILTKTGARITVEVMTKRHVLDGREMQQVAFRNLTDRKRAEKALLRANKELEAFSYSVAHDLRSPLRAINGYSQVLLDDHAAALDDQAKRYLERIAAGADTMGRLIDALLSLSRVARREVRRETVDLTRHAEGIAKQLQAADPDRVVHFTIQPGVVAQGDSQLLRALLDNLIGNAWKFTSKSAAPHIAFGCTTESDSQTYFVKDNGAGFDMDHARKLFGPFQRLHRESDFPGTGIGLATVQRIVERHGGRVWAESSVNRGATFYFTLQAGALVD